MTRCFVSGVPLGLTQRRDVWRPFCASDPLSAAPEPGHIEAGLSLDSHELGHLVGKLDAAPGHPMGAQLLGHDHILARPRSLGLEERTSEPGLPNDREESPHPKLGVIGDGNRPRRLSVVPLHDDVAPAPAHLDKAVFGEGCYRRHVPRGFGAYPTLTSSGVT